MSVSGEIYRFVGSCHCGAVRATLVTTVPPEQVDVQACQCGFCLRHGAATASDPAGYVTIVAEDEHVSIYGIGGGNVHTIICSRCGVYVGAVLSDDSGLKAILNVRGLAMDEFDDVAARHVDDERETIAEKTARRRRTYTPAEITFMDRIPEVGYSGRA